MGYTAYAYVVFGVEIERKHLIKKEKIRGCAHNIGEKDKFCSICGAPKYKEKSYNLAEDLGELDERNLSIFFTNYESPVCILGFSLRKKIDSDEFFEVEYPSELMRDEIMNFIREHDLPFTKQLKTYSFIYHSY